MEALLIHADRSLPAIVDGASLPWTPSPDSGVDRRILERVGGEVAIASSIVRYRPGSRFHGHRHALGEEFLVLSGTFSDEMGDYPQGSYMRNPPNSAHAPFSEQGCVIFVKLRQMGADENEIVRVLPNQRTWRKSEIHGHERAVLYNNDRITVTLERLRSGAELPARAITGGEEILVVEGGIHTLDNDQRLLGVWTWSRRAGAMHPALKAAADTLLWIKRGHLR